MSNQLSLWDLYNRQNDTIALLNTHNHDATNLTGFSDIAISGSFTDLLDLPQMVNSINGQVGNVTLNYDDVNAIPKSASCNKNWSYVEKTTQPKYVWGCNDNHDMFIYNPSKLTVLSSKSSDYALTAGSATSANSAKTADNAKFAKQSDVCNRSESSLWQIIVLMLIIHLTQLIQIILV